LNAAFKPVQVIIMSSSVLQIIVNGEDNASRMLSGVGDSLGRFGKQALGAGAAMTAMTAPLTLMGVLSLIPHLTLPTTPYV